MRGNRLARGALLLGLLLGTARAADHSADHSSDVDALLSALKQAQASEVRGAALLELAFPPNQTPLRQARLLPRLTLVPGLIRRNFTVTLAGQETLAGRQALRYLLTPNNAGAARWTFWIDSAWNLPLAYQERTASGELARRAVFVSVNAAPARLNQPLTRPAPAGALKKALLHALPGLKLPAGFEPLSFRSRVNASGNPASEVVLSDGLNVLALVASRSGVKAAAGVAVRRLDGSALWLVGNLPQSALETALAGVQSLDLNTVSALGESVNPPDAAQP